MKTKILYRKNNVALAQHPVKGFCVLANRDFKRNQYITTSPVSLLEIGDIKEASKFNDYPMYWNGKVDCIAFGEINLLNHSDNPSIYLKRDYKKKLIKAYALRPIKTGEELTINYVCKLWFDVV